MSKGIIQDKINQIATETEFEGVTHVEVAELLTLINNDKVDKTEAVAYESGFQGSITPDTLPASGWIPGIYTAEVSGTYNNAGGIVVNLNDGYTALIYNGITWSKIVLPIDVNGIIPDWSDQETGLQFPKTRIFENFLYRVKPGQTATSVDVPGISDKWERLNEIVNDNNEFLKVDTDKEGNIIFGIKKDGTLYSKSIEDLQKAVKITSAFSEKDNAEYIHVITDSDNNIIFGIKKDGTLYSKSIEDLQKAVKITSAFSEKDNAEYIHVITDSDNNIVLGVKKDGTLHSKSITDLQKAVEITSSFVEKDNDEFLKVETDKNGNIVFGVKKDGTLHSKSITDLQEAIKIISVFSENNNNNDEWINIITDKDGKILSGRKINNTLVEQTAIETPKISIKDELNLSTNAFNLLVNQFKNTSIGVDKSNFSDFNEIKMPLPNSYLTLNLLIDENDLPKAKPVVIPVDCELWDKSGNYFKKPVKISVQGDSSSGHLRKGFTLDLVDFTLQFGNLVASDSYYLKGFYTDAFRGVSIVAYRFFKDVVNSRPYQDRKAFYSDYTAKSIATGAGTLGLDMSGGANYIADGFPIALYCNGVFYGMYCIVQKKHRDNFDMKKNTAKHVWLDGYLSPWFFFSNNIDWTAFEVRNPKNLKNMDGSDYNGDFPKEIQASTTKTYIQNFAGRINEINAETTTATKRTKFLQYFDLKSIIDYFLVSNLIYNNDGFAKNWQWYTKDGIKWAVAVHDCDAILGMNWKGNFIDIEGVETYVLGIEPNSPTNLALQLFKTEIKQRYDELKALKIFTSTYFVDKLKNWLDDITYPMLKADLEKWSETPSYRASKTNDAYWVCVAIEGSTIPLWSDSTAYVIGDKVRVTGAEHEYIFKCIKNNTNKNPITGTYTNRPFELGFYNSLDRVRQVIEKRITIIETTINN